MKLLLCVSCNEIFSLSHEYRECRGGHCGGRYTDNQNLKYWGPMDTTFVLGFSNSTFVSALRDQLALGNLPPSHLPGYGMTSPGREFKAFVIPDCAPSVHYSTKELTQL